MKTDYKSFPAPSTETEPYTGAVFTSYYDLFTVGAGYVDIQAALANVDLAARPALSPPAVFNSSTKKVTLVNGSNVVWGDNVVGSKLGIGRQYHARLQCRLGDGLNESINPASVVRREHGVREYGCSDDGRKLVLTLFILMSERNNVLGGIELNAVTLPASS